MDPSLEDLNLDFYEVNSPSGPNPHEFELENGGNIMLGPFQDSPAPTTSSEESDTDTNSDNEPPPQLDYAIRDSSQSQIHERVAHGLIDGKNLLIECPPGENRRLSIVKTILNFWQWKKNGMPLLHKNEAYDEHDYSISPDPSRIYIATRNFLETEKIMQEIKSELGTTQLLWNVQISVLDHRKNLCINEDVARAADIDHCCRKLIHQPNQSIPSSSKKSRQDVECRCEYYRPSVEGALPFVLQSENGPFGGPHHDIHDIEDFKLYCGQSSRCSYYDGMRMAREANLIICPAEFLFNPVLRDEYCIKLDQSIVYIDDGYDLENVCKKDATLDMTLDDLNNACLLLRKVSQDYQRRQIDNIGLAEFEQFLPRLCSLVANNVRNRPEREEILQVISSLNINAINIPLVLKVILEFAENSAPAISDSDASAVNGLRKLIIVLGLLSENTDSYHVKVTTRESRIFENPPDTVLLLICANPNILFKPVEQAATSVILGSNIIAPYTPFDTEFDGAFEEPLKIQADPMVRDRLHVAYTNKGVTGVKLALDFDSRNDADVKKEIGLALLKICETIPNGKVGLFHSEDYLRKLWDYWQRTPIEPGGMTIKDALYSITEVTCELEMRTDADTVRLMNVYQKNAKSKKGAILLALHRGKLYKDWDLKYESVRAMIHISIPFGPWYTDDDIMAKRKYLERRYGERDCIQNKDWYHKEAFRKLNQSFCYTMQKKSDWGVVIVLDARMHGERHEFEDTLPEWVAPPQCYTSLTSLIEKVEEKMDGWTGNS